MHAAVKAAWHAFSTPLEGRVPAMYVDVKGLVTCGVGNLIDPISLAEQLPWTLADGSRADLAQVRADWHLLKDAGAHYGKLHWKYAMAATKVRLTDDAIDALVEQRLLANVAILRKAFPQWDSFPADGQLGILSMAWAVGAGFTKMFGNFTTAVNAGNWKVAIAACKIREAGNPGIVPRNAKNRFCFANADLVTKNALDVSELHWPEVASAPVGQAGADEETHWTAAEAKARADAALDIFVTTEAERLREHGSGAALLDYEAHDTDPLPPPGEDDA